MPGVKSRSAQAGRTLNRSRVHVVGASGSGTTTLGAEIATWLGVSHVDTDDAFWEPTDPPYQRSRPRQDRLAWLAARLHDDMGWVLSGSLCGWGDQLISRLDLVVFLFVPTEIRLARPREREVQRYGDRVADGGDMATQSEEFLAWAGHYDTGTTVERSLALHSEWLTSVGAPILRIEGDFSTSHRMEQVRAALTSQHLEA